MRKKGFNIFDRVGESRALRLLRHAYGASRTMVVGERRPLRWVCDACGRTVHVQKPILGAGPSAFYCDGCERAVLARQQEG